jgi:hypothetical protein
LGIAALDGRTGAVSGWNPKLPRGAVIAAFAAANSAITIAYSLENELGDVWKYAIRSVDRKAATRSAGRRATSAATETSEQPPRPEPAS